MSNAQPFYLFPSAEPIFTEGQANTKEGEPVTRSATPQPKGEAETAAANKKRGGLPPKCTWSEEDDEKLRVVVAKHGPKNWTTISKFVPGRTGKQCRERYKNHLDPNLKKHPFEHWEDMLMIQLLEQHGPKWSIIAKSLPGRTDNGIKNRYNASLRRAHLAGQLPFLDQDQTTETKQTIPDSPPLTPSEETTTNDTPCPATTKRKRQTCDNDDEDTEEGTTRKRRNASNSKRSSSDGASKEETKRRRPSLDIADLEYHAALALCSLRQELPQC